MKYDILFDKNDACVILSEANRFYFTQFTCSSGCVILTPQKKYFITDFRYEYIAKTKLKDFEVIISSGREMLNEAARLLKTNKVKNAGIEYNILYSEYEELKSALSDFSVNNISPLLTSIRMIKTETEISIIQESLKIAETAILKASKLIKQGVTERELSAQIIYEMLLRGVEKEAFTSIIASGINAAYPHYETGDRAFEKGDLIMIDVGAKYKGYCSDITRTLPLGTPGKDMQKIYNDVLDAQNYALKNIKAGITAHEADSFAREFLLSRGYDKEFGHSLGHGVGIEIHEAPSISNKSDIILEENMVITVEPGIYKQNLGGVRIEDMVVITKEGIRNLTNYPKVLII